MTFIFFHFLGCGTLLFTTQSLRGHSLFKWTPLQKLRLGGLWKFRPRKEGGLQKKSLEKGGLQKFQCVCQGIKNKYVYMHIHYVMMFQAYFFQRGSLKNLTPKKSTRKRGTLENFEDPPQNFCRGGSPLK